MLLARPGDRLEHQLVGGRIVRHHRARLRAEHPPGGPDDRVDQLPLPGVVRGRDRSAENVLSVHGVLLTFAAVR